VVRIGAWALGGEHTRREISTHGGRVVEHAMQSWDGGSEGARNAGWVCEKHGCATCQSKPSRLDCCSGENEEILLCEYSAEMFGLRLSRNVSSYIWLRVGHCARYQSGDILN